MDLPVNPPVEPMLARARTTLPEPSETLGFEPKWDGFRCLVFRDGGHLLLQSRNAKPLQRWFPELVGPLLAGLPERIVLDGELVIPTPAGFDFDALSARIHPAESRVEHLARAAPAAFIAFDILSLGEQSLLETPFADRRRMLETVLSTAAPPLHLTPHTTDRHTAEHWLATYRGAGVDGVVARELDGLYTPGRRTLWKVKQRHTADVVVAGFRHHRNGGVGSLLLGLFDEGGRLHHVGVASSFRSERRHQLEHELSPWHREDGEPHPWLDDDRTPDGTGPGSPNRWNAGRDSSFVALRPELVAEVAYDHATAGRFRGTTRLERWRPDRSPASCLLDQLAEAHAPEEVRSVAARPRGRPDEPA